MENQVVDTGLACLTLLARFHSIAVDPEQIAHQFGIHGQPFGKTEILTAAKKLGLKAKVVKTTQERLSKTPLPAMAIGQDGDFFVLARLEQERVLIHCPKVGRSETTPLETFTARWMGELILFSSPASFAEDMARFDFTWFIPAIIKYRKLLGEVFLVSFVLQLVALVTPLFFQVVVDKVLVHHGLSTLDVISIGFLCVVVFEGVLTVLRSYVFSHTTSRIDVELGARLFRHLFSLPTAYFKARRVGDSVARVRELENIRSFLTGNAITCVLDFFFSFVFMGVMLYYSGWLSLIVFASLPIYILLSFFFTPLLRSKLREKFNRGAENQAFLVEAVSCIDTVKAMALEPEFTRRWDKQLAAYVAASFRSTTIGTFANNGIILVSKLVTVATLWVGARFVMGGELTVGQLIAFNMLAGYVATPIIRLAQLWTDFQQTGVSIQRLGDILNSRTEVSGQKMLLPPIQGKIEFEDVFFRYQPDGAEVLRGVQLVIQPGEVIGIVGQSGSGKSTLTKLIQRFYIPERGRVFIDGIDLALVDASSLRRQIGVVLQNDVLFSGTIRENIALAFPGASLESVMEAAKLAGAHAFILDLPLAYDTPVGEQGATLSGGQRQRIAIARALMNHPRILILDEATSALDYESEKIIQDHLKIICRNRTVIIIAHRLSAIRGCDRIIALGCGSILESGTHETLLKQEMGYYARLYRYQNS